MTPLVHDLIYAFRSLAKSPGFTAIAIVTLALGIGANTAIYSFIDGTLLNPLPYENSDRIVRVLERHPNGGPNGISTLNFLDWQRTSTSFEAMAAQTGGAMTLAGEGEPESLRAARVSAGYFDIFRIRPALGRTFLREEDQPGHEHVVVLSHRLWRDRFGSDPAIVNRSILLDKEPYTVVGVLREGSAFDRSSIQLWRPLAFEPSDMTRNFHWMTAWALLKPGTSLEQARREMDAIGKSIADEYPASNKNWGVVVDIYQDLLAPRDMKVAMYTALSATAMVLLIGCANLANLALVRGVSREREVAIRASLGAGRWRLIRQFLTEKILVAMAGGVLGIGVGYATMRYLLTLVPSDLLPRESDIQMDAPVLLFALAISAFTGLLFGLAPALQATSPDLASATKDGGRGSSGSAASRRLRDGLVVAEIALAFMLLVGAGLMMRSFFGLIWVSIPPTF